MKFGKLVWITVAVGLSVSALAQAPRRDGRWEVKTEMEMPGMPMKMPAMTTTQCITKEQAEDPQRSVPQGRGAPNNCKVSDYKVTGNKVTWSMKCEGPEAMSGTGEITYGENTYDGVMKMEREGQTMTMKYAGKRLGDCPK
jgi:Protein of unknown function (DUF3617)